MGRAASLVLVHRLTMAINRDRCCSKASVNLVVESLGMRRPPARDYLVAYSLDYAEKFA